MAKAGAIIEYEYDYDGETYALFSKPLAAEPFIGVLPAVASINPTPVNTTVGGFTRRRYPGGPTISVSGHTRRRILAGAGLQRTLPGQNAFFEEVVGEGIEAKTVTTTVTHTGPFLALLMYAQANAAKAFTLRSQDGTPFPIAEQAGA